MGGEVERFDKNDALPTCGHVSIPRSCFTCGTGRFADQADEKARPAHGYNGWANGAAYCICGHTFDSVEELDRHVIPPGRRSDATNADLSADQPATGLRGHRDDESASGARDGVGDE